MQRSILVIDDQWVLHDLFRLVLKTQGYKITSALTAPDGLRRARSVDFDLVILGANIAGANGWELLEQLRREHPERPVVMIAGFVPSEQLAHLRTAGEFGPFDILQKPFAVPQLRDIVERALAEHDRLAA